MGIPILLKLSLPMKLNTKACQVFERLSRIASFSNYNLGWLSRSLTLHFCCAMIKSISGHDVWMISGWAVYLAMTITTSNNITHLRTWWRLKATLIYTCKTKDYWVWTTQAINSFIMLDLKKNVPWEHVITSTCTTRLQN